MDAKEKLSLEDVYIILESEYVAIRNENIAQEKAIEKAERNSRGAGRTW